MSDDEVVASYGPPRSLFLPFLLPAFVNVTSPLCECVFLSFLNIFFIPSSSSYSFLFSFSLRGEMGDIKRRQKNPSLFRMAAVFRRITLKFPFLNPRQYIDHRFDGL